MSFTIFSKFETTAKHKFKGNNALANIAIAKFLEQSCQQISHSKHSNIFAIFHTKSSRLNYIASELVLQYLEKRGMKITIQCANNETRSKYFRKHSDKWIQRELHLRTRLDLFCILISDRKKKVISTNVLKSPKTAHNVHDDQYRNSKKKNQFSFENKNGDGNSSSFITPSPTPSPSPKNSRIVEYTTANSSKRNVNKSPKSQEWPIYLSSSSSKNSDSKSAPTSPNKNESPKTKSKNSKFLNVTEISTENQFYYQKKVVNEFDDINPLDEGNSSDNTSTKTPNGSILLSTDSDDNTPNNSGINSSNNNKKSPSKKNSTDNNINLNIKSSLRHSPKTNDSESETTSENYSGRDRYSVSEAVTYRTNSVTDKSQIPRFLQLKKKTQKIEMSSSSPPNKERQVSFADQQNPVQPILKNVTFNKNKSSNDNKKFSAEFDKQNNSSKIDQPSSLINSQKNVNKAAINIPNEGNEKINENKANLSRQIDQNSKQSESDEDHIPKVQDNNDVQKHRRSREGRKRVRLSKNMPPKNKPIDDADEYDIEFLKEIMSEKTRSGRKEKYEIYKQKTESIKVDENTKTKEIKEIITKTIKINESKENKEENDAENDVFYFQEQSSEGDWDKIANSESCSDLENPNISNKFIKKSKHNNNSNSDSFIDGEYDSDTSNVIERSSQVRVTTKKVKKNRSEKQKNVNLSFDDNCFYFEKQSNDTENSVDIGVEVKLDSENKSQTSHDLLEIEEEEEEVGFEKEKQNFYSVSVSILGAKNVIKTDLIKTCDPYCKVIIQDNKFEDENEEEDDDVYNDNNVIIEMQTKVAEDTQNPEWNEKFTFNVQNIEEKAISFLIFDKDVIGSDKLLNSLKVPLSKFENSSEEANEWMTMKSKMQIGTLTDLHLNIKMTPEFGSLDDINFDTVNKIELESNDATKSAKDEQMFDIEEDGNEANLIDADDANNEEESEIDKDIVVNTKSEEESEVDLINSIDIKTEEENENEENKNDDKNEEESEFENNIQNWVISDEENETENNLNNNGKSEEEADFEKNVQNWVKSDEESENEINNDIQEKEDDENQFLIENTEKEKEKDSSLSEKENGKQNNKRNGLIKSNDQSHSDNESDDENIINIEIDINV
ncbi:hypothetical protein M9Y10_045832 [Tritrichomonas musculus]|uniref:C2 domain-containing protein n=1 Tax=Tritrichomonas musculus TaxID=1915356 RepID=A0ABR2JWT2_9EUKA